ncbi:MAG: YcxB family protein [Hyphomicrobiales bacterium]|nr:YcxB family protein [Hyphomicrobiales bacterium]
MSQGSLTYTTHGDTIVFNAPFLSGALILRSLSFTPSEADTLAAHRTFLRYYVFSWSRMLKSYLPIWWIISFVIAGVLLGVLGALHVGVNALQMVGILVVALGGGLALVAFFLWLSFAGLPRLVKRNYAQQAMLRVNYTVCWSDEGFEVTTPRGTIAYIWGDFIQWAEGPETVLMFQSDRMFNFIPKSACSSADLDDLRRIMAAVGLKRA